MSEPKLISPMLDGFSMGDPFSNHHGVRCCPAMPGNSDSKYIVKVISIPASQVQLQALLLTGAYQSEAAARDYFLELAQSIVAESDVLDKLSKQEGFLPFDDHQIVPKEEEVGYDVYFLSSYRRSLARHLRKTNMTHLAAINLGLDLCAALTVCRRAGYLYADLKPENIYICNDREFRIGDLGFMKLDSLKFTSIPERCISAYTAPEIVDAFSDVNPTIDIYAAGLILYQVYNGGTLPFEGRATDEVLPAPEYADYELAEIILKACAPDPKDRWQDPYEMGQALVAYMQRNGVNDTPIVVSTESHEEEPVEEAPAESELPEEPETEVTDPSVEQICLDDFYEYFTQEEAEEEPEGPQADAAEENTAEETEPAEEEEDYLNLSFLDALLGDDTHPSEEMAADFTYDDVSEDASSILSMADDLISHEILGDEDPENEEAAPDPIIPLSEAQQLTDAATKVIKAPVAVMETQDDGNTADEEEYDDDDDWLEDASEDTDEDEEAYDGKDDLKAARRKSSQRKSAQRRSAKKKSEKKKLSGKWIAVICILLLLCTLAVGGYLFYKDYYLRSVNTLTLEGSEDQLVVRVSANVDESLLTVLCVDTYGTPLSSPVKDGKAVFDGLNPNTLYRVKVEVEGLRKLTGKIEDSYTTPVQTDILSFTAVTGTEPGTAVLSFTVDGMDSTAWSVRYWADGEEEKKVIFGGHMVNISDLVSGKTYTFKLEAGSNLYITGIDELEYTAIDPVVAENLAITAVTENSLDVSWTLPEGTQVESWTVRCYSDSGYDETIVTGETAVTFTGINGNEAHTVEVLADGMSTGSRCYMTANAVTISDVSATQNKTGLLLTWEFFGNTPAGPWILTYIVDGAAYKEMVRTNTNSAVITPLVPGAEYSVSILLEDGTTVFSKPFTVSAPEATRFSGYLTGADYITASMCRTPNKSNWSRTDLAASDYTDTFAKGSKASFLLYTKRNYNTSSDVITTMFVIHAEDGTLVSSNITQQTWTSMWYKRYCELDVPALPEAPGTYTITIYFNGAFVHSQNFYVTE